MRYLQGRGLMTKASLTPCSFFRLGKMKKKNALLLDISFFPFWVFEKEMLARITLWVDKGCLVLRFLLAFLLLRR